MYKKTPTDNCGTGITTAQLRNLVVTAKPDAWGGGEGQFNLLNVLIVFVMFKTLYLLFYTSVFLTTARFSTYITNGILWCSKTRILRNSSL